MKQLLLLSIFVLSLGFARAQGSHDITGTVIDTTKLSVPGASVKIKTDLGDSTIRVTGIDGKFNFAGIKANKVTLTVTSIGYQGIIKHFTFNNDNQPLILGNVVLKTASKMLAGVTIVGVNPITLKEDTTQYSAAAYKVRDNAPVEDLVKKLPGVDVDGDGNISTKGKQITKVRINGKDVFGGDVQSITKNLPADVVENIQMIDDYGDQANLTGIKTGEPSQIMNITIRKDKNYGYSANITGGGGRDALPSPQPNDIRYTGLVNTFKFNGDQQFYLLGNLNNTNARVFNFGGGGGGFGGGGGGGRGNAARGGGSQSGVSTQNGITAVHTGGLNYRDQWGTWSVYGSYSIADNTTNTISSTKQEAYTTRTSTINNQSSNDNTNNLNHRFTWNMEWKPDTVNYLKITPTFSYAKTLTDYTDAVDRSVTTNAVGTTPATTVNNSYRSQALNTTSITPNYGAAILYNHRFRGTGRNFSAFINANSSRTDADQNPIYEYLAGPRNAPANQLINNASRASSISAQLSYIEPLGKRTFLEGNYTFSYSHTTSDRYTDTLTAVGYVPYQAASNSFAYDFTTNRFGLNFRFVEQKYNYTLGLAAQPGVLEGASLLGAPIRREIFNIIPTARFIYNFSRSQSFTANYNGSANQPSFSQLQPVLDISNASFPVQGNPNLSPEFNHNVQIRYNKFSFQTGDMMFLNFNFTKTDNKIVTNSVTYPVDYLGNPVLRNTITSEYLNADGYYTGNFQFTYAKPWANRRYTVALNGNVNYTNNIGYLTIADAANRRNTEKNIAKALNFTPNITFRTDITDVIDTRLNLGYAITKVDNSVKTSLTQASSNVRAFIIGLSGKNYFWKDWTLGYDYNKTFNYGYTQQVTNPNLLAAYIERRFLKNNMATIRLSGNDLFNENAGYSLTPGANGGSTETSVNRLGRYFMLTLNIRLQKFAGKAPDSGFPGGGGERRRGERGQGGGGGFGGPGGM